MVHPDHISIYKRRSSENVAYKHGISRTTLFSADLTGPLRLSAAMHMHVLLMQAEKESVRLTGS